jgi:filamentous hemagglutinin family protein
VQFDITGGTRPGGGANLFHSFGEFGVPTNNIANFLNTPVNGSLPATSNILGRVTGGNISNIFGTIQTTGFGNANFFLMNPAGFLFGPNATVNVGGMVAFTTADYLRLDEVGGPNAGIFHADLTQSSVLTSAPVAAFGFLGSNPAAIAVQGSTLTVAPGQSISLVGGNGGVTMTGGTLSASGGQINLASVASLGEVSTVDFMPTSGMTMGNITLSQGATLDVSGNAAGTVRIRGGQFVMDQATISADTANANGASIAVDIQVTGDLSITADTNPAITARTTGSRDAGEIRISSASMNVTANPQDILALIDSHTSGTGTAGNVTITTGDLQVTGDFFGNTIFIDSGTIGSARGHGGDVMITADRVEMELATISSGNLVAQIFGKDSTGSAGNITVSADTLHLSSSALDAGSIGRAGDIAVTASDIQLEASFLTAQGFERGGAITVNADRLVMTDSEITTQTNLLPGGGVTILANVVELTQGSQLVSNTGGDGDAGSVRVTANDHLSLLEGIQNFRPTGITTTSVGSFGSGLGHGGDVFITTPRLEMTSGARINTATQSNGRGGNVTVNATDSIFISGEFLTNIPEPLFNLGNVHSSGIFTSTIGGKCAGPCGDAGRISITTGSLNLGSGGQIDSGTSSSGQGGTISINAGNTISMSGTLSSGQPGGIHSRTIGTSLDAGSGGNIALTAGQSVTISDGASVSASSTGPGNTGNIQINAGNQFAMTNSTVTTEATQASGGSIKITTTPGGTVQLTDSTISASVLDGTGGGGSVNIDPQFVILQNSQILAQATQGPGGNIFITTNLLLPDTYSTISASSQFGVNGTVTIQSPNAPGSGQIQPLGKTPLLPTTLLNQRCAALAGGEFSSFTVAGRDSLPTEPGSWLASPLATLDAGIGRGGKAEGVKAEGGRPDIPILSLRQIAPAGFLTQAFAVDWSAGCTS